MGFAYSIHDQKGLYFVTFTVHQWVDIFTRRDYVDIILENLDFCQKNKGLKIYAWVIMSNHLHMIVRSDQVNLSDLIRDFKKHTAKCMIKAIENNPKESRRSWLLWLFKKGDHIWFWEKGYHGEEIFSSNFFYTKYDYIHLNPVRAGVVELPEHYIYSSYAEIIGLRGSRLVLSCF